MIPASEPNAFHFGRLSEVALAFTAIVSVAVALHTLAHVAKERDEIAKVSAQVAATTIIGAAVGWLPELVFSRIPEVRWVPEIFVLGCVAILASATLSAAQANLKFAASSKFRTVSISFAMVIAEASFVIGLVLESSVLRGTLVSLVSALKAMTR